MPGRPHFVQRFGRCALQAPIPLLKPVCARSGVLTVLGKTRAGLRAGGGVSVRSRPRRPTPLCSQPLGRLRNLPWLYFRRFRLKSVRACARGDRVRAPTDPSPDSRRCRTNSFVRGPARGVPARVPHGCVGRRLPQGFPALSPNPSAHQKAEDRMRFPPGSQTLPRSPAGEEGIRSLRLELRTQ